MEKKKIRKSIRQIDFCLLQPQFYANYEMVLKKGLHLEICDHYSRKYVYKIESKRIVYSLK